MNRTMLLREKPAAAVESMVQSKPGQEGPAAQANRQWPELDGLRALAFALVFVHHANMPQSETFPRVLQTIYQTISNWGWAGVDLFFVLSSFLITGLLLRERQITGRISYPLFMLRRTLRIWPLYFFYILVVACLLKPLGMWSGNNAVENQVLINNFLAFSTFTGNFAMIFLPPQAIVAPFMPLWSVSIEEQFYATWGFLLSKVRKVERITLVIAVLFIATIICRWIMYRSTHDYKYFYLNTFARLDPILLGALAAIVWLKFPQAVLKYRHLLCVSATGILICVFCFLPPIVKNHASMIWAMSAIAFAFAAFLLSTMTIAPLKAFFASRILRWFGRITYGLYIYHLLTLSLVNQFVLNSCNPEQRFIGQWLIAFPVTIALAFASWHLLEKRFCELKPRFAPLFAAERSSRA